ncbi:MAG: hypothetical protein JSU86_14305 [Phycisphaerales bacterium]|nr:MAG: hypothetical protein JSU86_14305 [Phycisphaerales bacterium]
MRTSINNKVIPDRGGIYGDKDVGYPVEYERLRLVLTGDVVGIEAFDHGITLFMTEDEKVKCIRRVPCKLDERKE